MSLDDHGDLVLGGVKTLTALLAESGTPDPKLLEGSTWDVKRYEQHVDERIYWRQELLFRELGVDRQAFELARRLVKEPTLRERVEQILAREDLAAIHDHLLEIRRDERAVVESWLQHRIRCCERCGSENAQQHNIRHTRWLCEECAKSLARRQRTTSTNIEPALRESRRLKLEATLTLDTWLLTIARFKDHCAYCDKGWDVVEHVTPTRRHGGTTFTNCLPACHSCNRFKGAHTLEEWIVEFREGSERKRILQSALDWLLQNGRTAMVSKL